MPGSSPRRCRRRATRSTTGCTGSGSAGPLPTSLPRARRGGSRRPSARASPPTPPRRAGAGRRRTRPGRCCHADGRSCISSGRRGACRTAWSCCGPATRPWPRRHGARPGRRWTSRSGSRRPPRRRLPPTPWQASRPPGMRRATARFRPRACPGSTGTRCCVRSMPGTRTFRWRRTSFMGGNYVGGIGTLEGEDGRIPRIVGACPGVPPGTLCADDPDLAGTLDVQDAATLSVATASEIDGHARRERDHAGPDRGRDGFRNGDGTGDGGVRGRGGRSLQRGRDLDQESGTGTPRWTQASIFGDTIIRDGNSLTGVTRVESRTGIFGTLTGAITVRGCLRSREPLHPREGLLMAGFRSIPLRAATSGTRSRRMPRRGRRGLGLMDADPGHRRARRDGALTRAGRQATGPQAAWSTGEARTMAALARFGRLVVEGDVVHGGRTHGENAAPHGRARLADLVAQLDLQVFRAREPDASSAARCRFQLWRQGRGHASRDRPGSRHSSAAAPALQGLTACPASTRSSAPTRGYAAPA